MEALLQSGVIELFHPDNTDLSNGVICDQIQTQKARSIRHIKEAAVHLMFMVLSLSFFTLNDFNHD